MNEERLVDIETKLAYQDQTINELNKVIYQQQKQIDQLEKTYQQLLNRLRDMSGLNTPRSAEDEKPPHY